ncbi:aldehyde dehydrogenase family protein [Cupriavidus sp. 2TAF22]
MIPMLRHFIDGQAVAASSGLTLDVTSPVTESVIATMAAGTREDVDRAVQAARAQLDGGIWSRMSGTERGRLIGKLADLCERDAAQLLLEDRAGAGRRLHPGAEAGRGDAAVRVASCGAVQGSRVP